MIRAKLLIGLLLITGLPAWAQNKLDINLIPANLLHNANAVVRNEETTIQVIEPDNVEFHVKSVVTVFNRNGDSKVNINVFYDKISSIKYIKGFIYNEFGKVIQKINESDFDDYAASDGFSLYQDDRVKHYRKTSGQYPYTIELEYALKVRQSLYFPSWEPCEESNVAIEKSSFQFICDPGFNIRYKQDYLPGKASISTTREGKKEYSWNISNFAAWRDEPLSPPENQNKPRIILAPEAFAYEKYSGSFSSWQQLGKWEFDNLLKNRTTLPDETANYIKSITAGISDPKLKAKKVYEYMQQKTHYISIQVGIGGLQPFKADEVDKDGYGDCKALVNYTKALLHAAGIDSWYCEVYGNSREKLSLIPDFPSIQGNHVILCLPFKNDTTWLECTDQQIPFGFLGDFTDDRNVLACTPEGGKLLHTPKYRTEQNLVTRKADFILNEGGDLEGEMTTSFKGADYDDRYAIVEKAQSERLKDFKKYCQINNIDIKTLEYKLDKSLDPATFENVKLSAREYGAITDGKYYFSLNSVDRQSAGLKPITNRVNPVTINHGHTYEDRITYTLPAGWKLDSEPLNVAINQPFGSFSANVSVKNNQLVYVRKLQIKDGTYNKEVYSDLVDFYNAVVDADNYNVILVKK